MLLDRVGASLALDARGGIAVAPQQACNRAGVERGAHGEQAQLRAQGGARVEAERQPEVRRQAAFVKFVEDDPADAVEGRVVLQKARQDAFGDDFDARVAPDLRVHAHAVADGLAGLLAEEIGHAARGGAGGQAARLQHDELLRAAVALEPVFAQQRQRDARGLARPGGGFEDGFGAPAEGVLQLRQGVFDGQVGHGSWFVDRGSLIVVRWSGALVVACGGRPGRGDA